MKVVVSLAVKTSKSEATFRVTKASPPIAAAAAAAPTTNAVEKFVTRALLALETAKFADYCVNVKSFCASPVSYALSDSLD